MEYQVNAAGFLLDVSRVSQYVNVSNFGKRVVERQQQDIWSSAYFEMPKGSLTDAATAMHLLTSNPLSGIRVVIMPNLEDLMKLVRSVTFSSRPGSCLFLSLYLQLHQ